MGYRFSITSLRDNRLAAPRSCFFARLMDCINSLLDIIFNVSVILFQSSRLTTTALGLPSVEVMYSTFGRVRVFNMITPPIVQIYHIDRYAVKSIWFPGSSRGMTAEEGPRPIGGVTNEGKNEKTS